MTAAEARQHPPLTSLPKWNSAPRFSWESMLQRAFKGGMPIPMFLRDENQVQDYWKGWLETSIYRDLANCFKKSYQPEITKSILRTMGRVMADGELPTLSHFEIDSRRLRNYLEAMETIFMVRRISCHERGIGKDLWVFGDSGLAGYYIGNSKSDEATLSLIRHALWNETSALLGYLGVSENRQYFKSARGTLVDWVWDNVPMKIVTSLKQRAFQERALRGAMGALDARNGYLIAPTDRIELPPKTGGVGALPWSMWS